jgi:hypothetical protein
MNSNEELNNYINEVINLIDKDMIYKYNPHPKADRIYIYNISYPDIPNHPKLPYSIVKTKLLFYYNDYQNIYPIKELVDELKNKYPNYKIEYDVNKDRIIIRW